MCRSMLAGMLGCLEPDLSLPEHPSTTDAGVTVWNSKLMNSIEAAAHETTTVQPIDMQKLVSTLQAMRHSKACT